MPTAPVNCTAMRRTSPANIGFGARARFVANAPGATSNASRQAATAQASSSGDNTVGVPPPIKSVRTGGRPRAAPARRISSASAAVYGSNSRSSPA